MPKSSLPGSDVSTTLAVELSDGSLSDSLRYDRRTCSYSDFVQFLICPTVELVATLAPVGSTWSKLTSWQLLPSSRSLRLANFLSPVCRSAEWSHIVSLSLFAYAYVFSKLILTNPTLFQDFQNRLHSPNSTSFTCRAFATLLPTKPSFSAITCNSRYMLTAQQDSTHE